MGFPPTPSRPSFSITVIGILTLALGANLASFTIVHALFLGHAPLPRAGELVRIYSDFDKGMDHFTVSYPNYEDVAALTDILSAAVAEQPMPFTWRNDDGPHRIWGSMVSPNYFEGLEVPIRHGRGFSADEAGSSGHNAVAVLAHRFWVT